MKEIEFSQWLAETATNMPDEKIKVKWSPLNNNCLHLVEKLGNYAYNEYNTKYFKSQYNVDIKSHNFANWYIQSAVRLKSV